ncbi:single-strand DNA-binding protein [Kribbella steppae]|uniref:Single-strand DNA-binding protein n=1 Tax=Kribbella steppae TaxID=2512223 RepID=A0A4R2HWZ8_9ACTN|nr:single-stranded DNA-binding protein [Kribbella steppae]TCO36004.1 single-strand DNA-binding protein [Kribbella steppae]
MSLGETYVTVQGWVGSDPDFKEIGGQTARATFRMGSTPRQYDRTLGTYVDKPTTWFTVECWRALAQNAFDSVHVGQPVIVTGRLRTHEWTDEAGESRSRVVLEAFSLGHDLTRGTTTFTKTPPRPASASATVGGETASEAAASPGALGIAPSSDPAEATASPFPADEYTAAPIPLSPTTRESEAA